MKRIQCSACEKVIGYYINLPEFATGFDEKAFCTSCYKGELRRQDEQWSALRKKLNAHLIAEHDANKCE